MANRDKIPTFRPGDRLSAAKMEALAIPLRQMVLPDNSFQSGNELLTRRRARPSQIAGTSTIRMGRLMADVAGAGNLEEDWPACEVTLQDETTGDLEDDPTDCVNVCMEVDYVEDAQVFVDVGYDPPRIINGTCDAVTWTEGGSS